MNSPPSVTGRGPRMLRGARVNRVVLVVVVTGAAAAIVVAPDGWRWPAMCGVLVIGATLGQVLLRDGWAGRLAVGVIGGLLATAAVTLWQPQSRAYAAAATAMVVTLYPAARLAERWDASDTLRRQVRGFLRGFATGAVVAIAALVILGLYERHQASFAMRYGQEVTVIPHPSCGGLSGGTCDGSTWTIDGRTYVGRLLLGDTELAIGPKQAYTVPGDSRAYSPRHYSASVDGLEVYGFMPAWLVWPILLLMVLVAVPPRVWRRVRPAAGSPT